MDKDKSSDDEKQDKMSKTTMLALDRQSVGTKSITGSEHRSTGKRKKKRRRRPKDLFTIPGVIKLVLSELAQKIIGCVAGRDVTTENPWTFVDKELVQDNLELHEESSEFLPIRKEILHFRRPKLLIGYVPDESRDYDEFYICVTEKATDDVTAIIEKMKKEQEERLNNAVNKTIKQWASLGTEDEVDESILKDHRPLIEVEVETKYPIFPHKVQFKLIKAQQRRDGYVELRSTDETFTNIYRKRIDAGVQVAPRFISAEAQTNCSYPANSATQYLYEPEENKELLEQCKGSLMAYANEHMEDLSDILTVNGVINLYSDDYSSLALNPNGPWAHSAGVEGVREFMSFMDVNLCKGKKIAKAVWHPMWTGIVAIAYADAAINDYFTGPNTDDMVMRAVHGVNPVLIWSISDALKPKLILESPREVLQISFCPFDENILIGGCKDGQIVREIILIVRNTRACQIKIIWDIRNRLHKVEELQVLTPAQVKYRMHMNALMGWMKNVHDLALVRPTAVSDPRYSHKERITGISWMSPFHEFSKIGNLMEIPEDQEHTSMQFLTCSEDGIVQIWDLLKKPKIEPGGFKVKKLKRLKKKPSALMVDVSPYRALHLNLKPLYKVYLRRPGDRTKNLAICACYDSYCKMKYVEKEHPTKRTSVNDRVYYTPLLKRDPKFPVLPRIDLGTVEGDYTLLQWEGQDFDSGEVVNSEAGRPLSFGKFHDGPVTSIHSPSSYKATLTAGGRIFALWRDDFKDRPVLWRRCKYKLTSAKFNMFQPYMFTILLMSGHVQHWILVSSSKHPVASFMYSNQYITANATHPLKLKRNIYGAGDKQGAFRLFFIDIETKDRVRARCERFVNFLDREVQRKKEFIAWQAEWNARHDGCLQRKEDDLKQRKDREEEERKRRAAEILQEKAPPKPAPKGPQPGKFVEWMIEQRQLEREARIKAMVITKKQLDTKELEKRRKPLQKLEEDNEMKKRKQKQRLKEGDLIFHNTVAALFPEMVKEKPPPPPDPYAGGDPADEVQRCYEEYESISEDAGEYIEEHPYSYQFDWRQVQEGGKTRRRGLDENGSLTKKSCSDLKKGRSTAEDLGFREEVEETSIEAQEAA